MEQDAADGFLMTHFLIVTAHQMLLVRPNQGR